MHLATLDDIQGLIARGQTIQETVEIARNVAKKLIELQSGGGGSAPCPPVAEAFDYPLIVNA